MKINDVLKPFVQELNSFLEHFGGTVVFRVNDMTNEDLANLEADELDNMVRDTLPDDDYFEMNHYFD